VSGTGFSLGHSALDDPAHVWIDQLAAGGYNQVCRSRRDYLWWKRYRRSWRRIFSKIPYEELNRVLEIGVGGGAQLMPFALNGRWCCGLDVSAAGIKGAFAFKSSLEQFHHSELKVKLIIGDWLSPHVNEPVGYDYDLVFNAGVIEHYLDQEKRLEFLRKKLRHLRPGGWFVSIVPAGTHPLRSEQRKYGWGGYNVPEIDYDPLLLRAEAEAVGGTVIAVLPHRHFGYLPTRPSGSLEHLVRTLPVFISALPGMAQLIPSRYATTLVLIGQKR
jgi:SAM-dependent methyltransferase